MSALKEITALFDKLQPAERDAFHRLFDAATDPTVEDRVSEEVIVMMNRMKPIIKAFFYQGAYARQREWEKARK